MSRTRSKLFCLAVFALGAAVTLPGCSGSYSPASGMSAAAFAGRRVATIALPGSKTGAIDFTVAASGEIDGTLTVSDLALARAGSRQAFSFSNGIYSITGSVDPNTGAYTMTGTIGGQPFTLTGVLAQNGSGGSYTLTAGGQTYSGSYGGSNPNPTPTPTPTPTPGGGQGGTQSLTFTNNTSNAVLPPFATPEFYGFRTTVNNGVTTYGIDGVYREQATTGGVTYIRGLSVSIGRTSPITTGVYTVGASVTQTVTVGYVDTTYQPAFSQKTFIATSGTVEVVSLTTTRATYRLTNVVVAAPGISDSTGSFTINGDLTVDLTTP